MSGLLLLRASGYTENAIAMQTSSLDQFLKILRELQKINPEFPLQYAVCLAHISMNEGLSLTSLSEKTGLAISTVSRIVGALSIQRQKGAGFGLVKVDISPSERRRKELYLTLRGREVISSISGMLEENRRIVA